LLDAMPALESRELSCRFCYFLDIFVIGKFNVFSIIERSSMQKRKRKDM
jgi:hypothetical protein